MGNIQFGHFSHRALLFSLNSPNTWPQKEKKVENIEDYEVCVLLCYLKVSLLITRIQKRTCVKTETLKEKHGIEVFGESN